MLKLKFEYFGHLMQRTDSLKKTLMPGEIEGRRRRGPHMVIFSTRSRNESPGISISLSEAADTGANQSVPRTQLPPGTSAADSLGTRVIPAVTG